LRSARPILIAAPLGLVAGMLIWLIASRGGLADPHLDDLSERLASVGATSHIISGDGNAGATALATPLFALTTGPGAVADPSIELSGISHTANRSAALVSIGGKPAEWLVEGETRDGVTLDQVLSDQIEVDTPAGSKQVMLGASPASPPAPSQPPAPAPDGGAPPPGIHSPPPPASAP